MRRYWTYALHAAAAAGFVLAVLFVAGLALPFLADSIRGVRASLPASGGDSGLIFVESPEVYTRQRLVNDRYLQDSWLREKLTDIDDEDEVWIDTVRLERELAALSVGADAEAPSETAELPDPAAATLSFERKFELQSNARDTIRQMILENALDDRHDLSGNTVFGLKFDTSVLPGSRTTLNPTVIVRMEANPLESLPGNPETYAPYFNNSAWSDTSALAPEDIALLEKNDGYFEAWKGNLEERLNKQRSDESDSIFECTRSQTTNASLLDQPLCQPDLPDDWTPASGSPIAEGAIERLDTILAQGTAVDDSLGYVLRIPRRNLAIDRTLGERYRTGAGAHCGRDDPGDPSLRGFIDQGRADVFPLPPPWETLFEVQLEPRISTEENSCGIELDMQLNPLNIRLLAIPGDRTDSTTLFALDLRPVPCSARLCADGNATLWTTEAQTAAAASVLDQATVDALIPDAALLDSGPQLCFGDGYYFQLPASSSAPPDAECGPGLLANFRIGAYQFLRRMTEVESYTYAAFPRGDVSGVVTETGSSSTAGLSVDTPRGPAGVTLGRQNRERLSEAVPGVINFASGDRHELFDFGWSIVKDGYKTPMIASQLVLVSVPAYLDEIELEVIKGFLDLDQVPADWTERRENFAAMGSDPSDEARAALLEERVSHLFRSWERRTLNLKVPPDYRALDGIVIGNSEIGGPLINRALTQRCYDIDPRSRFTLAIPGERLWRSTVVTLEGRKASQIEVMPNMEGILATFAGPEGEQARASGTGAADRTQELTIWTSEGRDAVRITPCPGPETRP